MTRLPMRGPKQRRGAALLITMFFTMALAALAMSAIYLNANATLLSKSYDKEDELKYAAEAALAIGKSRLNFDPTALPDTGYETLELNQTIKGADNAVIPGVTVNVYAGPSGSTSGQAGRFASIVAEARDVQGNGFVRRLELSQESFAKFAYWSNQESNNGSPILFGGNDQLWGPVWSNDNISLMSSGATFHDDVATAGVINGAAYGTFVKGYRTNQRAITLPTTTTLSRLSGYAALGGMSLSPPTTGDENTVRMRIEFVAIDMNGDGDSTDVDEGFFKVYTATSGNTPWLRSDWPSSPSTTNVTNCGDWHSVGGVLKFFPVTIHNTTWFQTLMALSTASGGGGMTSSAATTEQTASVNTIMGHTNARCYLGGDPHLVAVERSGAAGQKGGEDTTFTATDSRGAWQVFNATPNATIAAKRPYDAAYLFPIYRGYNTNAKGVIYAGGTVGVSGVLRGKITLYTPNTVVILDDLRYANDPGTGTVARNCVDILGIIAGTNTIVANTAMNTPQNIGSSTRNLDDTKDLYIHAVIMTLNTSFQVEDYASGPTNLNDCEGTNNGRGCLYLTGGLIQQARGAVGTSSGSGFTKRYSYDRCAVVNPPPYFPTTGRFADNRYYELDPVGFNVRALYASITPDR